MDHKKLTGMPLIILTVLEIITSNIDPSLYYNFIMVMIMVIKYV